MRRIAITLFAMAGLAGLTAPASAASVTTQATAKIVKPLVMAGGGTVALGTIVAPTAATYSGTFTVQPAATQTGTFCAASFVCSGTPTAAMFNMQGTNNTDISLTIPLTVTMTLQGYTGTGAAPTLTLTTKNSLAANSGTGNYTIQLPNSGSPGTDVYVGGSITVTQATVGGSYAGSFTITADYL